MTPTTTRQWSIQGQTGFDNLKFNASAPIPKLGDHDVLVKIHYASLNYRDLAILKNNYPFPLNLPVVPGSDGAGEVVAVGPRVTRFKVGDKVVTLFNQGHQAASLTIPSAATGLGGVLDGTLTEYSVFDQLGLVEMPCTLSFQEAATLSCAAVTAWNALFGLEGKPLKAGQVVLTQGTGGVSIFAAQFALAAGATVIGTTSSVSKAEILKSLGVQHVINYRDDPNWGETARQLTQGKEGVDFIIEVGGVTTIKQSLKAIKIDGVIGIVGFVGGNTPDQPSFMDVLSQICTVRGLYVGSRLQFEDMNRAIDANNIKPIVDKAVFSLEELKEAYQYMWDQKHFGKLTIKVAS
ncbi:chaperonin 10-like protein [Leptodontidium sp. 2 PMI_412]|nr:chaperonin 10-like protein [Leptodontidium sp. 2 PMI_412]